MKKFWTLKRWPLRRSATARCFSYTHISDATWASGSVLICELGQYLGFGIHTTLTIVSYSFATFGVGLFVGSES
jgi:hypothetical protein